MVSETTRPARRRGEHGDRRETGLSVPNGQVRVYFPNLPGGRGDPSFPGPAFRTRNRGFLLHFQFWLSTSKIRHLVTDAYQPAEIEGSPWSPPNFSNLTGSAASEAEARGGRARPRGRAAAPRRAAGNGEGGGAEKAGGTRKAPALGGRTSGEGGTMMVGDQGGINILWKGS